MADEGRDLPALCGCGPDPPLSPRRATWRLRLVDAVQSQAAQAFLLILLFIDVLFVIAELALSAHMLCDAAGAGLVCDASAGVVNLSRYGNSVDEHGSHHNTIPHGCHIDIDQVIPHGIHVVEEILAWLSFLILIVFLLESLMLLTGYGPTGMLRRPKACIDFLIALSSVTLEAVFRGTPAGNALVITRCWRFIRLVKAGVKLGKGKKPTPPPSNQSTPPSRSPRSTRDAVVSSTLHDDTYAESPLGPGPLEMSLIEAAVPGTAAPGRTTVRPDSGQSDGGMAPHDSSGARLERKGTPPGGRQRSSPKNTPPKRRVRAGSGPPQLPAADTRPPGHDAAAGDGPPSADGEPSTSEDYRKVTD